MTIRVLHVVISMETGGLENGIVNLLNRHDSSAFQVDVLCLSARGELADRITSRASQVYFYHATGSVMDSVGIIREHLASHQYDIVHSHGFSTMLASYIALLGRRRPLLINGEHGVIYAEKLWQRLLQRFLFNRVRLTLSVSANLRDLLVQTFSVRKERFHPIINGVDTDRFHPDAAARDQLRQALGISDAFVIGTVGRMVPVKDYGTLIRAFADLVRQQPHCRLVMVGAGPEEGMLKQLAQELGITDSVLFLGRRNDVARLMNAFDLYAQVSLTEGLSNTILEAMATGLPIVATRVGGNTEIVHDPERGLLLEPGDVGTLTEYLLQLAQDPDLLHAMAEHALHFTSTQCGLQQMVSNYESVYRQLGAQAG